MVGHVHERCGKEVHIAVYAAHVPHVLTFKIRSVAPAEHLYRDVVLTLAHHLGKVKLSIIVATLGIAHILTIHPHVGSTIDAVEVEEGAHRFPTLGQGEGAAI